MPSFTSAAMAEGYAKARPPLHARIVDRIGVRGGMALDVGCGAGLSTAPLSKLAERVVGVDPAPAMVQWAARIAPGGRFLAARAEALPFRGGEFEIITAAGSLNYAELPPAFTELRRVIAVRGTLFVYDFSQDDFEFERPADGAIPLDPEILRELAAGFRVERSERFTFPVELDREQYAAYLRTELEEAPAVERGATLRFSGYIAWLTPTSL
jgi:ubiquinone/menaquinone biosynthesis C-methylase UbiE